MTNQLKERAYWRGYYSELIRLDAKKCTKGTACGDTCIPKGEQCRRQSSPGIRQRLKSLLGKLQDKTLGAIDKGLGKVINKLEGIENDKLAKQQAAYAERKRLQDEETLAKSPLKTMEQLQAVRAYTGTKYEAMNDCARGISIGRAKDCSHYNAISDKLEEAMELLPKNTAGDPHYRGISAEGDLARMFRNLKEGDTMSDPGFSSFSKDREVASEFMYSGFPPDAEDDNPRYAAVMLVTRSRKLTSLSAVSHFDHEEESLFPRGHKLRVKSIKRQGNDMVVEVEDAD